MSSWPIATSCTCASRFFPPTWPLTAGRRSAHYSPEKPFSPCSLWYRSANNHVPLIQANLAQTPRHP